MRGPARRPRWSSCCVERAYLLGVTGPELTVLIGGLRALGANHGGSKHGVFTDKPGVLTNDFFVNLVDMDTEWKASETAENVYEGHNRATGALADRDRVRPCVRVELGAARGGRGVRTRRRKGEVLVEDFVAAWVKVMDNDRFDLK